ncbi:MAG: hypothetical protein QOI11_3683 [Candidatus Eremiobacteraeota bacterium]|nr:hypothetical protein [Candidatus Eremiobacteraeota bacterium]
MLNDLVALSYADRRAFVNALRGLRRRPWRALIWVFWIAIVALFAWLRTAGPRPRHETPELWQIALQDLWVCGFVAAFGLVLALGGGRLAGFFTSRAEALLLVRAPLAPPLVAAYLQARAIATTLARTFARFAYVVLVAIPTHVTPLGLVREHALPAAATVAITSAILPRALARGAARAACAAGGLALVLAALLPLLRDALLSLPAVPALPSIAARLPNWHPGLVFDAVARGDLAPVGGVLLVALLCGAVFARAARDAYPELYAFSLAHLELRARTAARRTRGGDAPQAKRTRAVSGSSVLRGAAAFVWLDALTWSRRISPALSGLIAAVALAVGVGLGLFARGTDAEAATLTILTVLPNLLITLASTAGLRLAADLRRPLFWLGEVTLAERLAAWAYAPLWRDALFFGLAALGFGVLSGDAARALTLLVVALALVVLTRAAGVAVFALLPNALDQRGPAVFIRLALAYALVVPAAGGAVLAGFLARSLLAGAGAGLVLAVAEGSALIGFAAWRLAGRVDRLANA